MNKLLLTGAALLISTSAGFAADLYIPTEPLAISDDAAAYDWSGAYIGATIGGQGVRSTAGGSIEGLAVVAGAFGGYNFQADHLVFGVEADAEYSGFDETRACGNPAFDCNAYLNPQGSVRARLGYAAESALFYVTGGVALGNFGGSTDNGMINSPDSSVRVGWTVGGGIEAALNDNWFGRVEYRYTDLGSRDMSFDIVYPDMSVTSHAVRAGIGYKF